MKRNSHKEKEKKKKRKKKCRMYSPRKIPQNLLSCFTHLLHWSQIRKKHAMVKEKKSSDMWSQNKYHRINLCVTPTFCTDLKSEKHAVVKEKKNVKRKIRHMVLEKYHSLCCYVLTSLKIGLISRRREVVLFLRR